MSSKRRLRRNTCGNKVRHADQQAAKAAIHSLVRSMQGRIGFIQPYRCQFCSGWHIGHAKKASWK